MAVPSHHMRPCHGVVCGDALCLPAMGTCVVGVDHHRSCLRDLCALVVDARDHFCDYSFAMGCGTVLWGYLCRSFGGRHVVEIDYSLRLVFVAVDRDLVNQRASVVAGSRRVNRPLL